MSTTAGENCEEHGESIVELRTTLKNGRIWMGVIGVLSGIVLSFAGWVANDNLAAIRNKSDRIEGLLLATQRDTDRIKYDVEALKEWKKEIEEHVKAGHK